jgi:NOL1/NOP2/sun family putative RNA methylase
VSADHDPPDGVEVLDRYESIVDDFDAFLAACARPLGMVVRTNTITATPNQVRTALDEEGVTATPVGWHDGLFALDTDSPGRTWAHAHGWVHGQEEVSAIPPVVLDPEPGERVLDVCAAPGSKATQIAALMDDRGTVIANDDSLGRLSALRSNADRLGVTSLAVTNRDGRTLSLAPFGFDTVDRALVDVPCSCEGTIRKNPDALTDWHKGHVDSVAGLQKGLLTRAITQTRPGGTVVYSTCTFAPEENEAVVDHAVRTADCRPVAFETPLDSRSGVTDWQDESYDDRLTRTKRFYPHHNDTGGFFCAKLEVTE